MPPTTEVLFAQFMTMREKEDLSMGNWNPERKVGRGAFLRDNKTLWERIPGRRCIRRI